MISAPWHAAWSYYSDDDYDDYHNDHDDYHNDHDDYNDHDDDGNDHDYDHNYDNDDIMQWLWWFQPRDMRPAAVAVTILSERQASN